MLSQHRAVARGRALQVSGDALRQGCSAVELRQLQLMMTYRHRASRCMDELVSDFECCLGAGMDAGHPCQHTMQNAWMGRGDGR